MDTKKYIIEIPDNTAWLQWVKVSDKDGNICFDYKYPENLTPYTEPDIEQVRKEAYKDGYDAGFGRKIDASYQEGLSDAWEAARKIIAQAPAADVVQVVRCKDCKHVYCRIYHGWQEPIYTCTHLRSRWNTDNDLEVNPDGFCSYGERKGE